MADSALVYVLAYHPSNEQWDGKFHPIEVRVRRDGAKVRCRSGYFAVPDEAAAQGRESLLDVLSQPFVATGIGLIGSLAREGNQWNVALTVDAQPLTLTPGPEKWAGTIDALFVQEDAQGKRLSAIGVAVPLNWTSQLRESNLQNGARFHRHLDIAPSAARVRIVVRDHPSGKTGSLTIPLS